ncbi:hypothetical protein Tco_0619584 [Tanacetum coccineum]
MNRWLMEDKEELERNEVDSDLESTASSKPVWKNTTKVEPDRASRGSTTVKGGIYNYGGQHNYTCATTQKMAPTHRSGSNRNENPDIASINAQKLQTILPQIATQVTNNVNNANGGNGGNGGNNGCTYKGFMACNPKEYDGKGGAIALIRWIEKMQNVIDNSGCAEN